MLIPMFRPSNIHLRLVENIIIPIHYLSHSYVAGILIIRIVGATEKDCYVVGCCFVLGEEVVDGGFGFGAVESFPDIRSEPWSETHQTRIRRLGITRFDLDYTHKHVLDIVAAEWVRC